MNTRSIDLKDCMNTIEPQFALVGYNGCGVNYIEKTLFENGKPTASSPLTIEDKAIFEYVEAVKNGKVTSKKLLPRYILYFDTTSGDFNIIWYRTPSIKTIKFDKELKLPDYTIKVPGMIYRATRQNLYVCCYKSSKVPNEKTKIYKAPFLNVFEDGRVCMGNTNITIPAIVEIEDIIEIYERGFWGSRFTQNGNNVLDLWKDIIKTKQTKFDDNLLIETKQTLIDLI